MDSIEIIFKDIPKKRLDVLWQDRFIKRKEQLITCNIYAGKNLLDMNVLMEKNISEILVPKGGGFMTFSDYYFGVALGKTIISFSFDKYDGSIDFNFRPLKRNILSNELVEKNVGQIVKAIIDFQLESKAKVAYFGYEPASDADMCIVRFIY